MQREARMTEAAEQEAFFRWVACNYLGIRPPEGLD